MSWHVTPVQARAPSPPQVVGFSSPHQLGHQPAAQYQPATKYQPGYSENQPQNSLPTTPVQAQAQPSPQLVGFSSPHQIGYQPTAQYQPATKYQPGYSDDPQQSSLPATPVQAQVQHPQQPVGFSSPHHVGYQMTAQQQPTAKYQPGSSIDKVSTDKTVSTNRAVSFIKAGSTNSTVSIDNTLSTNSTVSTDNTVSTYVTVSTDNSISTKSASSNETETYHP